MPRDCSQLTYCMVEGCSYEGMACMMQEPGDEMGFIYDNGDHWIHDIRLVSLFPPEESNGRCQV